MDRAFKIAVQGTIEAMVIGLLTICSLLWLFFLAPRGMFSKWHMVVSLLGSLATVGFMLWSVLAQGRQKQSS